MTQGQIVRRVVKPVVFLLSLIPAALLAHDIGWGGLGANPVEEITHRTGFWGLTFLMITLSVTPLQRVSGIAALSTMRRPLGLFAFFYVVLHFTMYAVDQTYLSGLGLSPSAIVEDVAKRPYITVGFTALLMLIPLALTSTKGWIKRLGSKRWRLLHQLVYVAAALGVFHFLWLVKADTRQPVIFGIVLVVLLALRLLVKRVRSRRKLAPAALEQPS